MVPDRFREMIKMITKKCDQIFSKFEVQPSKIFSDITQYLESDASKDPIYISEGK